MNRAIMSISASFVAVTTGVWLGWYFEAYKILETWSFIFFIPFFSLMFLTTSIIALTLSLISLIFAIKLIFSQKQTAGFIFLVIVLLETFVAIYAAYLLFHSPEVLRVWFSIN